MCVAEWARTMPARRSASTRAVTVAPCRSTPERQVADVQDEAPFAQRVDHVEADPFGHQISGIADLPAAFAIERRLVEHDHHRLGMTDFVDLVAQLVLRDQTHDAGRGFDRFVAQELAAVHRLLERVQRAGLEQLDLLPAARFDAMPLHGRAVTGPVEREISLGGERFEQLGRKAVRGVHVGRFVPRDHHAAALGHLAKHAVDPLQAAVDRREEIRLFLRDHLRDARGGLGQLGVRIAHQLDDLRHQLVQERGVHADLMPVEHRPAQQPLDDVFFLVGAGIDVLVNGERAGADVIGDAPQSAAMLAGRIVS